MLRAVLRDQRGLETVQYVAMSGVVVTMIMAIWMVFYGGPGRTLRATVQTQIGLYANGFEGGLGTSGPVGKVPRVQGERVTFDPTPFQPVQQHAVEFQTDHYAPTTKLNLPFDPQAKQPITFAATNNLHILVQPMPGIRVTLAPQTNTISLFDPVQQRTFVFDPVHVAANQVDPVTNVVRPVSLVVLQQLGVVAVRTEPQQTQIVQAIKVAALGVPMLLH